MTGQKTIQQIAGQRANYQKKLAVEWLKAHRPEIWDKIWEAAFAEFPNPNGFRRQNYRTSTPLPTGFKSSKWK